MSNESLNLSPHEVVTVLHHTPDHLELEVTYDPRGSAPPRHFHPVQHESFQVVRGQLMVDLDGETQPYGAGDGIEVRSGCTHRLWNPFDEPVTAIWTVTPAAGTLAMFRAIDALHSNGRRPGKLALGRVVARHPQEFRLAGAAGRILSLAGRG